MFFTARMLLCGFCAAAWCFVRHERRLAILPPTSHMTWVVPAMGVIHRVRGAAVGAGR